MPQVTDRGKDGFSNGSRLPTIGAQRSTLNNSRDKYQICTPGRSLFIPSGGRSQDYFLVLFRSRNRSSQVSPDSESETRSASTRSPGLNGASSAGFLTRKVIVIPPINPSTASCVILTRLISGSRRMIRPRSSDRSSWFDAREGVSGVLERGLVENPSSVSELREAGSCAPIFRLKWRT